MTDRKKSVAAGYGNEWIILGVLSLLLGLGLSILFLANEQWFANAPFRTELAGTTATALIAVPLAAYVTSAYQQRVRAEAERRAQLRDAQRGLQRVIVELCGDLVGGSVTAEQAVSQVRERVRALKAWLQVVDIFLALQPQDPAWDEPLRASLDAHDVEPIDAGEALGALVAVARFIQSSQTALANLAHLTSAVERTCAQLPVVGPGRGRLIHDMTRDVEDRLVESLEHLGYAGAPEAGRTSSQPVRGFPELHGTLAQLFDVVCAVAPLGSRKIDRSTVDAVAARVHDHKWVHSRRAHSSQIASVAIPAAHALSVMRGSGLRLAVSSDIADRSTTHREFLHDTLKIEDHLRVMDAYLVVLAQAEGLTRQWA